MGASDRREPQRFDRSETAAASEPAPAAENVEHAGRDLVVVGASAGGVQALVELAAGLPADFPGAVLVVLHLAPGPSALAEILHRAGPLPARRAPDGADIVPGTICVAPPDHHLLVRRGHLAVLRGPKVNGHRPAVDVLFHSAALAYGDRVIGVVLTGARNDGALGLRAIKRRGGLAIVQKDPQHEGMPASAQAHVEPDFVVPLREIPARLSELAAPYEEATTTDERQVPETDLEAGFDVTEVHEAPGDPSVFRCPECGGALWEVDDGDLRTYACHVGHTFSAESMVEEQGEAVERAMWTAVRMLDERAALVGRLAERMEESGLDRSRQRFTAMARNAREQADVIRKALVEPDEAERAAAS